MQVRDVDTDAVLETIYSFSTDTGDVNPTGDTGWQLQSADLSSYIGQTVRLYIHQTVPQSGTGPAQIEFDDFRFETGLDGPTNVDDLISNFVAPAKGTYFIRVIGADDTDYSLVVTRGADFSIEDNDSFDTAQPILSSETAGRQWMLGSIGNETVTLDAFDSGWWASFGSHNPNNPIYFAGLVPGFAELRNFVAFDVPEDVTNLFNAELRLFNPASPPGDGYFSADPTETFEVFDVVTPVPELVAGGDGRVDIFEDLGTGSSYGSRVVSADDNGTVVSIDLNQDAIDDIRAASGGQFATGGALTTLVGNDGLQRIFAFTGSPSFTRQLVLQVADLDYYAIEVKGNQSLIVETATPANKHGEFINELDAKVWLYDSSGALVAWDDNGASDGINARLQHKVSKNAGGTYFVVVGASDSSEVRTTGEYILSVKGNSLEAAATAATVPLIVSASAPQALIVSSSQTANGLAKDANHRNTLIDDGVTSRGLVADVALLQIAAQYADAFLDDDDGEDDDDELHRLLALDLLADFDLSA